MEERALRSSSLVAFSTAASPSILFPSILPRSLQCLPWDGAARKKTEALAQGGKEESSLRVVSPASGGRGKEGREGLPVAAIAGGGGGAHLDIFSPPLSPPLPPNSQKALLLVSFTRVQLGCSSALDTASSAPPDSGPRTHTQQPPPLKRGRSRGTAQKQRQRQRSSV